MTEYGFNPREWEIVEPKRTWPPPVSTGRFEAAPMSIRDLVRRERWAENSASLACLMEIRAAQAHEAFGDPTCKVWWPWTCGAADAGQMSNSALRRRLAGRAP